MIQLYELKYTKAELSKAPPDDSLFFLMATGLANDLQTLFKLFAICLGEERRETVVRQGSSTIAMLLLRLIAGRIWEGWELLKSDYKRIEPNYAGDLGPNASHALAQVRTYFGVSQNLVFRVRNKIGFHADRGIVKRAFERLPDEADLGEYMSKTVGNTLYYSAEILHYEAIHGFTGEDDPVTSLHTLIADVRGLVVDFNTFIYGFVALFLERHLGRQLDDMRNQKLTLENVPNLEDLKLPFFMVLPVSAER